MTTFGLTSTGFNPKSADDVLQGVQASLQAQFGGDIDLSPGSVFAALAEIFSAPIAEAWGLLADVYASGNRATAAGTSLDGIGELINVFRLPGLPTKVDALLSGDEGTIVPAGSLAGTATDKDLFQALQDTLITADAAVTAVVQVAAAAANATYTVTVNKVPYAITTGNTPDLFEVDGDDNGFITSLSLSGGPIVAGKVLYWKMFQVRDVYLDEYIRFQLFNDPGKQQPPVAVYACEDPDPVFPLAVTLDPANGSGITGSLILQGYAEDTDAGNKITAAISTGAVAALLVSEINASEAPLPFTPRDNDDGTFTITPRLNAPSFSISAGSSVKNALAVTSFQCLQAYASVENDAIPCIAGDLSVIVSPVRGWNGIANPDEAVPVGQPTESDGAFRKRIGESPRMNSSSTAEAIKERLIQEVPGVQHAYVFPNLSDETDLDGRPPHTIEVIVDAPADSGTQQAVAQKILQLKPVGITTVGTSAQSVLKTAIDAQGQPHAINFSPPDPQFVWLSVSVNAVNNVLLPADWAVQIQNAILDLAGTYTIGQDVLVQKFYGVILTVPGIEDVSLAFAVTGLNESGGVTHAQPEDYHDAAVFGVIDIHPTQLAYFASTPDRLSITMSG